MDMDAASGSKPEASMAPASHQEHAPSAVDSGSRNSRGKSRGDRRNRGSRGGGGRTGTRGGQDHQGRIKKKETGRAEWSRNTVDKRARNDEQQRDAKRRKLGGEEVVLPVYATKFSQEEIAAEERKPKRKVAVMIGYSGSGYKGMQLNHNEKTIEGDLFSAFVAAGAISKANADDPKKSSLVRCARTDKGVHAAGNVISLKLVIEDPDVVLKINEHLSPQIRVWGIERTNGSFSAYQLCDSRIYEYLIPTHSFLPPHPKSFLGKMMVELAEEANDLEGFQRRQEEVADFWEQAEEKYIKPALEQVNPAIREEALRIFYSEDPLSSTKHAKATSNDEAAETTVQLDPADSACANVNQDKDEHAEGKQDDPKPGSEPKTQLHGSKHLEIVSPETTPLDADPSLSTTKPPPTPLQTALTLLKTAHQTAKRAYRLHPIRHARIRSILSRYTGSHKYHNYTIDKRFTDPSATRIIKTFTAADDPIMINNTEWLSLKVHGQSFMMHQIRKMVSMAALIVRCGCHEGRIQDSYLPNRLSIPKAPSLGLLLERPVFESYNAKIAEQAPGAGGGERGKVAFGKWEGEMEKFKQREIYERVFREEEEGNFFGGFWGGLDAVRGPGLAFLSSLGVEAVGRGDVGKGGGGEGELGEVSSGDEGGGEEEEGG